MHMCVHTRRHPLGSYLRHCPSWLCFTFVCFFLSLLSIPLLVCVLSVTCLCVLFLLLLVVVEYVGMHALSFFWRSEDNFEQLVLFLHAVSSEGETGCQA